MKLFSKRAEATVDNSTDDALLNALLGKTQVTRETAMQVPSVAGCVNRIAEVVSAIPINLYKEENGKITQIKDDSRVWVLNDDTGDTLSHTDLFKAIISDYYLGKGGYAYIHRVRNKVVGIHYVDATKLSIIKNTNPIFKDYDIYCYDSKYYPHDFIKILRNSKDGAKGISICEEHSDIIGTAYSTLQFEQQLVSKGGNKKGFLKSAKNLSKEAMDILKEAFRRLYNNNQENVVVLNNGLEFQESSNTSVEMQLNENKETDAKEVCKLFGMSYKILDGTANTQEYNNFLKLVILPLLKCIESAINRDLLLEKEKRSFYFAFDTKELLKGTTKERFEAYKIGIDSNVLQIDEARYMEDLEPLGLEFIKLGLADVLYNPKTKEVYTPNTGQTSKMNNLKGGENDENRTKE